MNQEDFSFGRRQFLQTTALAAATAGLGLYDASSASAQGAPKRGGNFTFAISAETPHYDAHGSDTFATLHFGAPFYSTLLQF
ncbi:MAG: twin-arginine translocation signal domain-containing protein, partial [Proteobacteria bacterium]|nr:twin-arginine translocation signal domain-containing protein [Pseudomonadota bacterium]